VDYESLIPYLSESIRANFNDIKNTQAKTDHIEKIVDQLYQQFVKQQEKERSEYVQPIVPDAKVAMKPSTKARARLKVPNIPAGCVIFAIIGLILTGAILGLFNLMPAPPSNGNLGPPIPETKVDPLVEKFQRAILQQFYTDTNGAFWRNSTRWMTAAPICTWHGIECADNDGYVTKIFLARNNLDGTLTPSLGNLTNLRHMDLSNNNIHGTIPPQIAELNHLQTLLLPTNSLGGPVPEEFSTMRSLQVLQIGFNKLTKLPTSLGIMTNLTILAGQQNLFRGTLPDLYGTNLVTVDLSSNYFEGPLPRISDELKVLILDDNKLNGTIENLYDLDALTMVLLQNNLFTGNVSFATQQWFSMEYIDLSNNTFTGVKEDNISANPDAVCLLQNNHFRCPLPEWVIPRCYASCT
jgi:hypothetical protein